MTITVQATLTCNEDGCTDTRLLCLELSSDRHLDSGYKVEAELPEGWTRDLLGRGHRCELHEDELHKRERLAYEARNPPEGS